VHADHSAVRVHLQGDHRFHLHHTSNLIQIPTQFAVRCAAPTCAMMRVQMSDRPAAECAQHQLGSTAESGSVVWVQPADPYYKIALRYIRIDRDGRTKTGLAHAD
jgi:hypothetical protein